MSLATKTTKTVWEDVKGVSHDTESAAQMASMRELLLTAAYVRHQVNLEVLVKLLIVNPDAMRWLMDRVKPVLPEVEPEVNPEVEPGDYQQEMEPLMKKLHALITTFGGGITNTPMGVITAKAASLGIGVTDTVDEVSGEVVLAWSEEKRKLLRRIQFQLQHGPGITQMGSDGYQRAAMALVDKLGDRMALEAVGTPAPVPGNAPGE